MKKIFTAIFCFSFLLSNAQISYGAESGINFSWLNGHRETNSYHHSIPGGFSGLVVDIAVSPSFSFQPAINFSSEGGKRSGVQLIPSDACHQLGLANENNLYADFKNVVILHYLNIPFLIKYHSGSRLKYFVNAGPFIGFRLEARSDVNGLSLIYIDPAATIPLQQNAGEPQPVLFDFEINKNSAIKTINAGIQAGAGVTFSIGEGSIFFDFRYVQGFTNINANIKTDGRNQTASFGLGVGYLSRL